MSKLYSIKKYFRYSAIFLLSGFLSMLIFNCFWWSLSWLHEKPFEILGIIQAYIKLIDFSDVTTRLDYVSQIVLLLLVLVINFLLFCMVFSILNNGINNEAENE